MKKIYFAVLVAVLALAPALTLGATFQTGQTYYLEPGKTVNDNLYAAGGVVGVLGNVNGDVMAAGGNISVVGNVSGDVALAGGNLDVKGNVAGDVRIVGGQINISNNIGGDLLAAGGQVSVMPGTTIGKDVAIAGGVVYIDSAINGNLLVAAKQIKLGPNAQIKGKFDYYSQNQATLENGAVVVGATNFHKVNVQTGKVSKPAVFGFSIVAWLVKLIIMIVAGIVLLYFFRAQTNAVVEKSATNFWWEVLRGFIVLVAVPVAVLLSFITVIGSALGVIALLSYILFIVVASIFAVLVFARLCLKYIFKKPDYVLNWWVLIVSALAYYLLSLIPFVGWIFALIIFLSALGGTSDFIYHKIRA